MRINRFRVSNYSSFSDTGWIELQPGTNIFVGENNAGKSAILRAIKYLENVPHRSPSEFRLERLGSSVEEIEITVDGQEIEDAWLRSLDRIFWPIGTDQVAGAQKKMDKFLSGQQIQLRLSRTEGAFSRMTKPFGDGTGAYVCFRKSNGKIIFQPGINGEDNTRDLMTVVWNDSVFMFDAQRFGLGIGGVEYPERLNGSAGNLSAVLNRLQGERPALFARLVVHVREIFSTIGNLSVRPTIDNRLEVLVWPIEEQEHPELSVGLNDSGTGVSQAIAILAVAMTLREAVVMIDEISSFLHPAAAKTLLRILTTNYPQHQYIISTHSPEVLSASSPSSVHFVRKSGFESSVNSVDLTNLEDLRQVTGQLGISMTDVFAVDHIIWVEGPTEELCFPYIYTKKVGPMPRSTMFVPVIATGDFSKSGTRLELVLDIYERLSGVAQPLITSVTFGFDRESLTEQEIADLRRRSGDRVRLLPRRNFECYLIDCDAIAALLATHVPDLAIQNVRDVVEEFLLSMGGDAAFKAKESWTNDLSDPTWLAKVDGAKLIKRICSEVSEQRFEFAKKVHSLELLKHRMESGSADLNELSDYVIELVEGLKVAMLKAS
ncbi:AAA family ATPase [Mesorhizobium sp. YC-39]|uniref:ATP-dependent nuclease n=1 Tax=unclassified Mesorhizobium TaxID=325217 RepID=UPI0021E8CE50|nr:MULTISPECIES: AAA family ATPase [unclassified Mesorhizobium]MCV3208372.1 AAA family ATPase [Mesorhizobium sp. YC-2]MCV3232278.1 AAA family ATPase [Mesorhizobium sp. YC-39]